MTQEQYDYIETAKKIIDTRSCAGIDCKKCPAFETWCKHENDIDFFVEYILEAGKDSRLLRVCAGSKGGRSWRVEIYRAT